jgi:hypothetical protein
VRQARSRQGVFDGSGRSARGVSRRSAM